MPSFRHLSRVVAMQTLFEYTMRGNDLPKIIHYNQEVFATKIQDIKFLEELVFGVQKNRKEIDAKIEKYAPQWPVKKLAIIDRVVLEIGFFELMFAKETPHPVIINEAVDVAKVYGDENSGSFINGVLSSASKDMEK